MNKEKIFDIIFIGTVLGIIAGVTIFTWVVLGQCEESGGEWDNITVECVEKGETTWDYWFPEKGNQCEKTCECLESCRGRETV